MQLAMPRLTPGVRAIIAANAAVFVTMFLLSFFDGGIERVVSRWFGISPGLWIDAFPLAPVWQLVTWGFLHDLTSPSHILFNMLGLYFFGTMLEELIGTRRLYVTYFLALLVSGAVTLAVGWLSGPIEILGTQVYPTTVGASGAVFCVIAAMATLRPLTRVIFIIFPMTLRTMAIIVIGLGAFMFLVQLRDGGGSDVSHIAHLSGAAWGYLAVKRGWIWKDPVAEIDTWREEARERRSVEDDQRVDELLEKINREGIHALTPREKAFLKRASKRR